MSQALSKEAVSHQGQQVTPLPRVWVLLGYGTGGNSQLLCLARALGWPYQTKRLKYNKFNYIPNTLLGASRLTLNRRRSDALTPPWPDVVIAASRRAAPVARWIKKQSGGRTFLVHLLHTQSPLHHFDLVVTTPQYHLPQQPNVLQNLLPLNIPDPVQLQQAAARWTPHWEHLPRPWIAVLVGGSSSSYVFNRDVAARLGRHASRAAHEAGGSLLITTSPRTRPSAADALLQAIDCPSYVYRWRPDSADNPHPAYLALADRFIVTADSASMLAEACVTGRPVEIFDWVQRWAPDGPVFRWLPIVRSIWKMCIDRGLIKPHRDFHALHRMLKESGALDGGVPAITDELERTVNRIRRCMTEKAAP
jgi:mitochondrial fission protein ELM1